MSLEHNREGTSFRKNAKVAEKAVVLLNTYMLLRVGTDLPPLSGIAHGITSDLTWKLLS